MLQLFYTFVLLALQAVPGCSLSNVLASYFDGNLFHQRNAMQCDGEFARPGILFRQSVIIYLIYTLKTGKQTKGTKIYLVLINPFESNIQDILVTSETNG